MSLSRLTLVKKNINNSKLKSILLSSSTDIAYLTGYHNFSSEEREAYLFITKDTQYLLTDGRYKDAVKNISNWKFTEISAKNSFDNILKKLIKKHSVTKLGIQEHNLTVKEHKSINKIIKQIVHYDLHSQRAVKDKEEIGNIEKACQVTDRAFDYILGKIKNNITELELAFELEYFIRKNAEDISFKPIVAYGANSAIPHHQTGKTTLQKGDFVLIDFGAKVNGYCSDITRTVFFGKPTSEQERMYHTVLQAQEKAIEFINHQSSIINRKINSKEVDKAARDYIISQGYPDIPHSLGHGIGLQVHEAPRLSPKSKDIIAPGMVFSIEPGIYIPDFGGVRIEDLVLMKDSGIQLLTNAKKNLIVI